MKRTSTCAFSVLAAAACMQAANVYTPKTYDLYSLTDEQYNSLVLDGKADEAFWKDVKAEPCNIVLANPGVDPVSPNGYAASWKATYDEYNMYILVEVTDATSVPYDGKVGFTQCDNIELFFSQDERQELGQTTIRDNKGSQLRLHPGYADVPNFVSGGRFVGGNIFEGLLSGCEYATSKTANGYTIEAIIPWDGVIDSSVLDIAEGKEVLFDINPTNVDVPFQNGVTGSGDRTCILGWCTTDFNAWKYNNEYGTLNLKGELAGINAVGADTDTADGPAEYFTIDGRRVSNPEKGLYILRQGNKASKVIF